MRLTALEQVALETTIAVAVAIALGAAAAWLVYASPSIARPALFAYAPFAISIVAFVAFAIIRLPRIGTSVLAVSVATVAGLLAVAIPSAAIITMIGCRYDACINL